MIHKHESRKIFLEQPHVRGIQISYQKIVNEWHQICEHDRSFPTTPPRTISRSRYCVIWRLTGRHISTGKRNKRWSRLDFDVTQTRRQILVTKMISEIFESIARRGLIISISPRHQRGTHFCCVVVWTSFKAVRSFAVTRLLDMKCRVDN